MADKNQSQGNKSQEGNDIFEKGMEIARRVSSNNSNNNNSNSSGGTSSSDD